MSDILANIKKTISLNENLENSELQTSYSSRKGDGLVGDIHRISLTGRDKTTGEEKCLNLVLKVAPTHQIYRSCMPVQKMYENEVYAYEKVLPILENECRKFGVNFIKYPKFYTNNLEEYQEYLVLEDLNIQNFKMWNNKKEMDDVHIHMVLRNCAILHASSLIIKRRNPQLWSELTNNLNYVCNDFFADTDYCDSIKSQAKSLDGIFAKTEKDIFEEFRDFYENKLKSFMGTYCSKLDEDFLIVHGDLWCNNLLFKYEDEDNPNSPTAIAILDFQAIRLSSVALDLSYFFYVCATKQRMERIDNYLKYYHQQLSEILLKFDIEVEDVFGLETFMDQWKRYNKFGFTMALAVLHGITSDSDEFPSLKDVIKSEKSFWVALNFVSRNDHVYRKRVKDLIVHFCENKYI